MPTKLTPEIMTAAIVGFEEQKRHLDTQIAELRAVLTGGPIEPAATAEPPKRKRLPALPRPTPAARVPALEAVREGARSVNQAVALLPALTRALLGFASMQTRRALLGAPAVVFAVEVQGHGRGVPCPIASHCFRERAVGAKRLILFWRGRRGSNPRPPT